MRKTIIDRSKWFCGRGPSALIIKRDRDDVDRYCCLGLRAIQMEEYRSKVLDDPYPIPIYPSSIGDKSMSQPLGTDLKVRLGEEYHALLPSDLRDLTNFPRLALETFIARVNDETKMSQENREQVISALFGIVGEEVEFVGELPEFKD